MEGNLNTDAWIGTHKLIVRGTNGLANNAPDARGNNGIFGSADSLPLTLVVETPCLKAKL